MKTCIYCFIGDRNVVETMFSMVSGEKASINHRQEPEYRRENNRTMRKMAKHHNGTVFHKWGMLPAYHSVRQVNGGPSKEHARVKEWRCLQSEWIVGMNILPISVAGDVASLLRRSGSTEYGWFTCAGYASHWQYKMRDTSPLEVFSDEADYTSHVALEDTTGADLGCDDLSNDSVKRSRSAACKTGL